MLTVFRPALKATNLQILGSGTETFQAGDDLLEAELIIKQILERACNSSDCDTEDGRNLHIRVFST